MKSSSKFSSKSEEKYELIHLQKENTALRVQLKELGQKLSDLIELREVQKSKTRTVIANPEEELKECNKIIEIYKKEKKFISKRLKKALDLNYYNSLTSKVEHYQKILNSSEIQKKVSELHDRKVNNYRKSPAKFPEVSLEIDYLNSKKHNYVQKINKMQEISEKTRKIINESNKKIEDLEKEHKKLIAELGPSYEKDKSIKQMISIVSKRQKFESVMKKETNSKVNAMLIKIKSLQSELKSLKDDESQVSSKVLNTSKRLDQYHEKIRMSPILSISRSPEPRSHSVKPYFHAFFKHSNN